MSSTLASPSAGGAAMATPTASAETSERVEAEKLLSSAGSQQQHHEPWTSMGVTCDAAAFGAGLRVHRYGNSPTFISGHRTRCFCLRCSTTRRLSPHLPSQRGAYWQAVQQTADADYLNDSSINEFDYQSIYHFLVKLSPDVIFRLIL